jgi:hypothetical protein
VPPAAIFSAVNSPPSSLARSRMELSSTPKALPTLSRRRRRSRLCAGCRPSASARCIGWRSRARTCWSTPRRGCGTRRRPPLAEAKATTVVRRGRSRCHALRWCPGSPARHRPSPAFPARANRVRAPDLDDRRRACLQPAAFLVAGPDQAVPAADEVGGQPLTDQPLVDHRLEPGPRWLGSDRDGRGGRGRAVGFTPQSVLLFHSA